MEVWKDIKGYEGHYQISNLGRIKSVGRVSTTGQRLHEKIMKTCEDPGGYAFVGLWKNGKKSNFKIHRLVLESFCPISGMEHLDCNHKDEDKTNNRLENLEWMTRQENLNYGTHNKRISDAHSVRIICVELNQEFDSIEKAAKAFSHSRGNIWRVLNKPNRTACGYHWRYAE
jgi:hypothetical protein